MNDKRSGADGSFSTTPPKQSLPPTPPRTDERKQPSAIDSVQGLRRYRSIRKADEADENIRIQTSREFDPHQHLGEIENLFRRFDCCPTAICVRMPSPIHELVIRDLEREYTIKQIQVGGKFLDIKLGGSSRVYLDEKKESRQPDIQFRHRLENYPRIIIEIAKTQPEKELEILAADYILKSDGAIKRVYGIKLNPLGKPSTVSEWRAKITPSGDEAYDEEVRVEKTLYKEFRATDGSLANPDECLKIPLSDFGMHVEGHNSDISISFRSIFNAYEAAQEMEAQNEMDAQPPAKRIKRIARTPSPVDKLGPEDEDRFRAAEVAAENSNKDSDFEPLDDEAESGLGSQSS